MLHSDKRLEATGSAESICLEVAPTFEEASRATQERWQTLLPRRTNTSDLKLAHDGGAGDHGVTSPHDHLEIKTKPPNHRHREPPAACGTVPQRDTQKRPPERGRSGGPSRLVRAQVCRSQAEERGVPPRTEVPSPGSSAGDRSLHKLYCENQRGRRPVMRKAEVPGVLLRGHSPCAPVWGRRLGKPWGRAGRAWAVWLQGAGRRDGHRCPRVEPPPSGLRSWAERRHLACAEPAHTRPNLHFHWPGPSARPAPCPWGSTPPNHQPPGFSASRPPRAPRAAFSASPSLTCNHLGQVSGGPG